MFPVCRSRDYVIIAFRSFHEGMNNASAENVYSYAYIKQMLYCTT
jgi:hypothetical protein